MSPQFLVFLSASLEDLFKDEDNFIINKSTATKDVAPSKIETIQHTTLVSFSDYERIDDAGWFVNMSPYWSEKKLKGTRQARAGKILKDEAPYWYKDYKIGLSKERPVIDCV